jgi:cytochrome c
MPKHRRSFAAVAIVAAGAFAPCAKAADGNDAGMLAFNNHCRQCHSYDKGDERLGPSLNGVVGRKAGSEGKFAYSDSLKNSGITWTPDQLDKWITNPNALVPNNNMGAIFAGLNDSDQRKKIIAFLQSDTKMPAPGKPSSTQ